MLDNNNDVQFIGSQKGYKKYNYLNSNAKSNIINNDKNINVSLHDKMLSEINNILNNNNNTNNPHQECQSL